MSICTEQDLRVGIPVSETTTASTGISTCDSSYNYNTYTTAIPLRWNNTTHIVDNGQHNIVKEYDWLTLDDILRIVNKYGIDALKKWEKDMDENKKKVDEKISPAKHMPGLVNVTFQREKGLVCAIWSDGSKTFVKCNNEEWDPVKGMAMVISKKYLGDNYDYVEKFKKIKEIKKYWDNK